LPGGGRGRGRLGEVRLGLVHETSVLIRRNAN
jgi:hypothetical protein